MKTLTNITTAIILMLCININAQKTETRQLGEFTTINASKGINITLTKGTQNEMEINVDGCQLSDVANEIKKGTLYLKMKKRPDGAAVQVIVTYTDINTIEVSSGASVETQDAIETDELNLKAGANTEVEIEVYVKTLNVDINSGKVSVSGEADKQFVEATATVEEASYDGISLASKEANVKASLNSTIEIKATDKIDATAVGGKISYRTENAKVTEHKSLGGEITTF